MSEKSFMEKALDLDHRIIASVVFVIITVILLYPISVPFPISTYGQAYYDFVHSIPAGSTVGFMMGDTPSTKPQMKPSTVLTMEILWEKNCKIIYWCDQAISIPLMYEYIEDAVAKLDRELEYGVDYVNLGYIAGEETGQAAFFKDIRAVTAGVDIYGTNLDELPIMDEVNDGYDMPYGFTNNACQCSQPQYVRQWQMPYGVQLGTINCAMDLPAISLYLATGQIKGTANGLLGSAEMEFLTGNIGLAYGQTLAVSFTGVYFTILVILGNIFYFATRSRRES